MHLTLAQGSSVTTLLAVAAVAILLTAAFYRRAYGTLPGPKWRTLLALRVTAILLVIFLLFRPVISYENAWSERPALIFLLDRSASMGIADDASGVSRFQQARGKLEKWCDKLKDDFRLLPIAFAEGADVLDGPQALPALAPTGKATSILNALKTAARQLAPGEVAAILLLSDGIHNAAGDPLDVTRKLGIVVHCIGTGASLRSNPSYRDIQATGIDCPDHMLLNNVARITGSIDAIGLGGRVVPVLLDEDGRQIAQAELTLDDTEGSQQVTFEFRPTINGRHTYTVRVPPVGEERIRENNQRSAVATVVEAGIRVLYLEGTLRAEYGAVVDRFLAKDPDLEFCALVQTRPNVFLKRTNMPQLKLTAIPADQQTIDKFDVFLLGDIDSSYLRPAQQEMFVKRVRAGAGLLMLGGYHSLGPGGYAGTPMGDVLPANLGPRDIGQVTEPFLPMLTPDGVRHPIFANIAGFFPTAQGPPKLPGLSALDGCTRVAGPRPGATVLATGPAGFENMPVLAVQPVDRGRTAVFTGDTTRKWQQASRVLERDSPFLQFWGQMVRWLAGRKEAVETRAGVELSADKAYYEPGEAIRLTAVVRGQQGQAAGDAKVVARAQGPAGPPQQVPLTAVVGPAGHYAGTFEPRSPGRHELTAEARVGELNLSSQRLLVEVGRPNLEFEKLDLDEKLLGRIAADTGGRYVPLAAADHLIDQLDRSQQKKTVRIEQPLYWPPGFWLLFVVVLTTEWILRRRYQLR
jgi:uncharacterized membrane protein